MSSGSENELGPRVRAVLTARAEARRLVESDAFAGMERYVHLLLRLSHPELREVEAVIGRVGGGDSR